MKYEIKYPRKIIFGCGLVCKLPELLGGRRKILLIASKSLNRSGQLDRIVKQFESSKIEIICGSELGSEAPLDAVDKVISLGRAIKADAVVAVGGGSLIDIGKAAAGIIPFDGEIRDYYYGKLTISQKGIFFAAVPTTAGTGSEISNNAVLSDDAMMQKKSIRGEFLIPDLALIDPELTYSCPPDLSASSGMDAFVQAVESWTSPEANTITKALATNAVKLLLDNLENAVKGDKVAKIATAEGSMLSGMAFSQTGLGAVHGLAHPIGIKFKIPHGRVCGILMRIVFRQNIKKIHGLYDELADACGLKSGLDFLSAAESLADKIGIPKNFSEYKILEKDIDFIVKNCRSHSMQKNPCHFTDEEIRNFLRYII